MKKLIDIKVGDRFVLRGEEYVVLEVVPNEGFRNQRINNVGPIYWDDWTRATDKEQHHPQIHWIEAVN